MRTRVVSILLALALSLSLSLAPATLVGATTISVPSQFATVQAAVDAAGPGDTITIAAGTFAGAVINKEVHIVGSGPDTIIGDIPQPFGLYGPKAGFYLPGPAASKTSISQLSFKPFDPDNFPNDGVAFPVFCRKVDGVKVSHVSSERSVQGVTLTSSTNSEVGHSSFSGVTTYFGSGGGIGVSISGEGGGNFIDHNTVSLDELFAPEGFSAVGISVIAVPSGAYPGSSHDVTIRYNRVDVVVGAGTQGVEVSTHAGYLPAQGPKHTNIVVAFNDLRVGDPSLALVVRPGDEVFAAKNLDGSKGGRGGKNAEVGIVNRASGHTGLYN